MRTRLAAVIAVAVLVVAGIVGWQRLDVGPIHRIVVSNAVWRGPGFWQIAIDDGDHYDYAHNADRTRGRIAFAPFARRLAAIPEIRYLSGSGGGGDGLTFWIEGERRTVAPYVLGEGGDHAALRSFAAALHAAVAADARRQDAPRIAALTSLRDLRAVEAISNGCFGRCGIYTIVFHRNGTAALDWGAFGDVRHRRARAVPWQRVVRDLHEAHVERLDRKYPAHAVDTWSATLRLVFAHATYSVEAPDSSSMPQEFIAAFTSMRRAAAAAAWSPALDADQLRTLAR